MCIHKEITIIKFEEHDGLIFKMLEKPVQLKEKNTNVLVRFITHGVIGEYVMEHWLDCGQENAPIFVDSVDSDGDVIVCIENGNKYGCPFPMFEIIGTPVAHGSAEWALWAMMEGQKVWSFDVIDIIGEGYVAMGKWESIEVIAFHFVNTDTHYECNDFMSIDGFLSKHRSSGWQLYKEPEPAKEPEIVAHKQHANCLLCGKEIEGLLDGHATVSIKRYSISSLYESTYSHYCGKCFLELGFDATERELRNRQQPIAKPEPAKEQFEVGDWVEWHEELGTTYQSQITRISHSAVYSKGICIPLKIITRKLKPSEVIVKIGCLRGIVRPVSTNGIHTWVHLIGVDDKLIATIRISCLDTRTRELVESLLEAMRGEK